MSAISLYVENHSENTTTNRPIHTACKLFHVMATAECLEARDMIKRGYVDDWQLTVYNCPLSVIVYSGNTSDTSDSINVVTLC